MGIDRPNEFDLFESGWIEGSLFLSSCDSAEILGFAFSLECRLIAILCAAAAS